MAGPRAGTAGAGVYDVPGEVDVEVARLKLAAAGIEMDELTSEQEEYLHSWRLGS